MNLDPNLVALIEDAMRDKMYGSIEIKLEAGKPVLVRLMETIRPEDLKIR